MRKRALDPDRGVLGGQSILCWYLKNPWMCTCSWICRGREGTYELQSWLDEKEKRSLLVVLNFMWVLGVLHVQTLEGRTLFVVAIWASLLLEPANEKTIATSVELEWRLQVSGYTGLASSSRAGGIPGLIPEDAGDGNHLQHTLT